ncbi:ArsR/SmtB family transcription factor [Longimicrobium sp.]|uniref:ArsR/SmtB family transcription factor n=1 Tax=Longimicrobium sp. TaxID=2029185 RepID=UPI003B3B9D40
MSSTIDLASVAALVGEPARAAMLMALMDGRAHTATELALHAGVTASTASSHLARLAAGGLVAIARQGRHRYFRIPTPEIGAAIEGLMSIAPRAQAAPRGPRDERMRRARVCYDHLAGEAGVRLLERLREQGLIAGGDEALRLTEAGEAWCGRVGIDLEALRARRRGMCRGCLDWSERRTHLAGAVGAALLDRLMARGYARREPGSRVVVLAPRGDSFIEHPHLAG